MKTVTFNHEKWRLVPKNMDAPLLSAVIAHTYNTSITADDIKLVHEAFILYAPEHPESAWLPIESAPEAGKK